MVSQLSDGYKRLILASASYTLETDYPDPETHIYTNYCLMSGNVTARDFHLHNASFSAISGDSTIDGSGKTGKSNQRGSDDNANGEPGHSLSFSSANFDADQAIHMLARGGDGGEGYSGLAAKQNGGDGGNGGNGGCISLVYNDTFRVAYMACEDYYDSKKVADLKIWVDFLRTTITQPKSLVDNIMNFGSSYTSLTASDLEAAVIRILNSLDSASADFSSTISSQLGCEGGAYGVGGPGTPKSGQTGTSGKMGSVVLNRTMREDDIRKSGEILYHPDQVAMTLRDIGNDYFLGTDESLLNCSNFLRTLKDRLNFLDMLKPGDPLFQTFSSSETNLYILPSGTSTPTSVTSLKNSLMQVRGYMSQLGQHLDIYCHSQTWVPRGSYGFYQKQLDGVMSYLSDIEDNYFNYQDKASDRTKKRGAIRRNLAVAQSLITRANSDFNQLQLEQDTSAKTIASFSPLIPIKRKTLVTEIEKLEDDIKTHFSVSMSDFLDAAAQFAFAPGLPMAAVQAGRLFFNAATTIPDGSNVEVNKDYLVDEVVAIHGDMDGLKEGLKMGSGSPTLTIDDPGAAKLLLEEHQLQHLIRQYRDLIKDLDVIVAMFDEYINIVLSRNEAVIRYNAIVTLQLQCEAVVKTQQHQVDLLNSTKLDQIDPELPMIAVFVQQSYFYTVDQVLKLLYRTERALAFWTLSLPSSNLATLRQGGFERRGLTAALESTKVDILTAYDDAVENSTSAAQQFGPITVHLSDSQLGNLKDSNWTLVTVVEAYSYTDISASPFANCADVRLTKVRFYAEGATTGDNVLMVSLAHTGGETLVDTNDLAHSFSHNELHFKFQHNYSTAEILTDGNLSDVASGQYALPGPFTTWKVEIKDTYNDNLELSDVTSARFEFWGWSKSF